MKIAIRGHESRGKEVIQILESLGGVNRCALKGESTVSHYYIDYDCDNVIHCHDVKYINKHCKKYTLEEFEKEFPFKIGDKVVWDKDNYTAVRTVLRIDYSDLAGIKYAITAFGAANCFWEVDVNELKSYKEMKKERNITLTLEKAKEWYKKGGELKEIALQAFSEEELTKKELPKTWEEFCKEYPVQKGECWFESGDEIEQTPFSQDRKCKNWIPSMKSAEAHLAMIQLEQLRDCWRQGWKPTPGQTVFAIKFTINGLGVYEYCSREFLSFKDRKTATEFLECFRDLIEKAGDLI